MRVGDVSVKRTFREVRGQLPISRLYGQAGVDAFVNASQRVRCCALLLGVMHI
jgi:hypothetical protein